jgi:hypothetical protein
MFALLVLCLSLLDIDHKAFEDCTIKLEAHTPIELALAVQEYNDLPDHIREC